LRAKAPVDLLLTDLIMPEFSGDQLIEAARLMVPNIKVLAMSGGRGATLEPESSVQQLQKPFAGKDLLLKLDEMYN
jgi:CheY-like chemotaxis protein